MKKRWRDCFPGRKRERDTGRQQRERVFYIEQFHFQEKSSNIPLTVTINI